MIRTHCTHGHELTPANTYTRPDGRRYCRICRREWRRKDKAKAKTVPRERKQIRSRVVRIDAGVPTLSTRTNPFGLRDSELRVVRLAANGYQKVEIARMLGVHKNTVTNYLKAAYQKTGSRNVVELTRMWIYEVEMKSGPQERAA